MPSTRLVRFAVVAALALARCACEGRDTSEAPARVQVASEAVFPHAWIGDTVTTTVAVTSLDRGSFQLLAVETPDRLVASWPGSPEPLRIGPGETIRLTLTWSPLTPGDLDAIVTVATDADADESGPSRVRVTGRALDLPSCDDANPCTDDSFDRATRACVHVSHARACDDGSACTVDDRCDAGRCVGERRRCDDGDGCTSDYCDPATGCVHVPDDARCDDGDPCTVDLCRNDTCSHGPANGTACGPLDCATAHVCVLGACQALDIRGESDGWPCEDGDRCSVGDVCVSGECRPGSDPADPVVATVPTWGAHGARAASDGQVILVAEPGALHVVRPVDDTLERVSTLELAPPLVVAPYGAAPVVTGPGRFVVALVARLALVDTSDPAAPRVVTSVELPDSGDSLNDLALTSGGVLATTVGKGSSLLFVPLDDDAFGPPKTVLRDPERLWGVAADGPNVVAPGSRTATFLELAADGTIVDAKLLGAEPVGRVAGFDAVVRGRRAVLRTDTELRAIDLGDRPAVPVPCEAEGLGCRVLVAGCHPSFRPEWPAAPLRTCEEGAPACPDGTTCGLVVARPSADEPACEVACCADAEVPICLGEGVVRELGRRSSEGARSLDLFGDVVLLATVSSIEAFPFDDLAAPRTPVLASGTNPVSVSGGFLFMWDGRLEVARLSPGDGDPVVATPLHGAGNGPVRTMLRTPEGDVAFAGVGAVGTFDVGAKRFAGWHELRPRSAAESPWILASGERRAVVEASVSLSQEGSAPCEGSGPVVVGVDGSTEVLSHPCGQREATMAAGGDTLCLLEARALGSHPGDPSVRVQCHRFSEWQSLPATVGTFVAEVLRGLRVSSDGRYVGIGGWERRAGGSYGLLDFRSTDALETSLLTLELPAHSPAHLGEYAIDEDALVLLARARTLDLYDLVSGSTMPIARLSLPLDLSFGRIFSMEGGRAWLGDGERIVAIDYGRTTGLVERGEASVTAAGLVDLGERLVGYTDRSIQVIAPECIVR